MRERSKLSVWTLEVHSLPTIASNPCYMGPNTWYQEASIMYTDGAIRSSALSWDTGQFTHLLNGPAEVQFSLCYDRHQIAIGEHHKYRLLLFIWRLPSILSASWVVHLYELLSALGRLWTTQSPFTDRLIYIAHKNSKGWLNCKFQSTCNLNFI